MNLSKKSNEYLRTLKKDSNWITVKSETERFLKFLNFPYNDEFIETQMKYSGLRLTVKNSPHYYQFNVISKQQIKKQEKLFMQRMDDSVYILAGSNNNFINQDGVIGSKDESSPRIIHAIYESVETKIAQYAILNEYYYLDKRPHALNLNIIDIDNLKTKLNDFELLTECSDNRNFWYLKDLLLVIISPWLGSPGMFIGIQCMDIAVGYRLVKQLREDGCIE